jgi:hypothetical protein
MSAITETVCTSVCPPLLEGNVGATQPTETDRV